MGWVRGWVVGVMVVLAVVGVVALGVVVVVVVGAVVVGMWVGVCEPAPRDPLQIAYRSSPSLQEKLTHDLWRFDYV